MKISGNTLYIGGEFTQVGGQTRNRLAAIDITTGQVTNFNPNANGAVYTIEVGASTIFVSGGFTNVGGQSRSYVAALDASTSMATSFNPGPNGLVNDIFLDGSTLYVGGTFGEFSVNNSSRQKAAGLNTSTALPTSFDPGSVFGLGVYATTKSSNHLFFGGAFDTLHQSQRSYLLAFDAGTSNLNVWDPAILPLGSSYILDLYIFDNKLFLIGYFGTVLSNSRSNLAAINLSDLSLHGFTANAANFGNNSSVVRALAYDGTNIFAGGDFIYINGNNLNRLAKLNKDTGAPDTAWHPNVNNSIFSIAASDNYVFIGGNFTQVGSSTRNYFAVINKTTGQAL